jgi:hypothetical protein
VSESTLATGHGPSRPARLLGRWNDFWFNPADPTPLGLIRILAGSLTFYVVLAYSVDLQELFGKDAWVNQAVSEEFRREVPFVGFSFDWSTPSTWEPPHDEYERRYMQRWKDVNPLKANVKGQYLWSVWFHVTDPSTMVAVHVGILAVIFLFTVGAATRVTSVLTWFGVVSYTQRAPTTLFGVDTMMNLLLIYLMIGPSGAALSVDRLVARYGATWRALRARRRAPDSIPPAPRVSANLALRLIQVNLCIIYLASGLSKRGDVWWNGQAVWYTMANPEFSPMHFPSYVDGLVFLCRHRWLWETAMNLGALFTLAMEIGFPFLVWVRPLRWLMLASAVVLHTGIAVFMGLNTFSLFMMTMLVAFVPLEAIAWLVRLPGRRAPRLRLEVNARDRRQVRAASLVRAVDVWDQVEVRETSTDAPPRLVTREGEVLTGFPAWLRAVTWLRLLRPLAPAVWLAGATGLGRTLTAPAAEHLAGHHSGANGKPATAGTKAVR